MGALGWALLIAIVAAAAALLLDKTRDAATAHTMARQNRFNMRLFQVQKRQDELARTITKVHLAQLEDMDTLTRRCDAIVSQLIEVTARTLTPEEVASGTARLLRDVRKAAEPGPPEPGSVNHTMPPDVTDSEGKRHQ